MDKTEIAQIIDAYADAKASGNNYLTKKMIDELEITLGNIFDRISYLESLEVKDVQLEKTNSL